MNKKITNIIDTCEIDTCEITKESSINLFLSIHFTKINNIANIANKKMKNIAQKMSEIKIYAKDDEKQNKEVYEPLMNEIKDYFNYIQNSVQDFPTKNPRLRKQIKSQLYKTILSLNKEKPLELLFCAQPLDADLLLACARRANRCMEDKKQRNFILCDMNMCRDFIELGVLIKNVVNVGILHHYIPVNLDQALDTNNNNTFFDKEVKQALLDVSSLMPVFIKKCLSQTENNLKVVLRSCYGVELPEEEKIPALKEVKAFPLTIALLNAKHQDLQYEESDESSDIVRIDNRVSSKGHIVIQQTMKAEEYETKLFLPINGISPIILKGFPVLNNAKNFELFAQKLIDFWPKLQSNELHINPYSIHTYPHLSEYNSYLKQKDMVIQGIKNFKSVFARALAEWEEGKEKLGSPKIKYNTLFTTTTDLIDAIAMPKGSYAEFLLNSIKNCPHVTLFKAYYADYRAGPDRTILEMDAKGKNASSPKALIVSRHTMWGQNKLTTNTVTDNEKESSFFVSYFASPK